MSRMLRQLLHDEDGQDLVEYGLIMMLVSLTGVAAIIAVGASIGVSWIGLAAQVAALA